MEATELDETTREEPGDINDGKTNTEGLEGEGKRTFVVVGFDVVDVM